jgi:hypothetical protein
MIGAAPLLTRIGRSGKHSSRQTGRDGYQKYAHHSGDPSFSTARREQHQRKILSRQQLRTRSTKLGWFARGAAKTAENSSPQSDTLRCGLTSADEFRLQRGRRSPAIA